MDRVLPIVVLAFILISAGCSSKAPATLGVEGEQLSPCPPSPNCVCSDAVDADHVIEPFVLAVDARTGWAAARAAVEDLPRTHVVESTGSYLHAECRSAVFRFVDDLELQLRPEQGIIAVRSASRTGYSDLGVNRARVEELRSKLRETGTVE